MRSLYILLIAIVTVAVTPVCTFAETGSGESASALIDTQKPVITRLGNASENVECGDTYTDAGATALDACTGTNLTSSIVVTNPVNIAVTGVYMVRYNVSDVAGNAAQEILRTVIVYAGTGSSDSGGVTADSDPPVITLLGDAAVELELGEPYTEAGATATDICDGDLTAGIAIGGDTVNTAVPGLYVVTYNVTDSAYNTAAEVIRRVYVVIKMTILLPGDVPLELIRIPAGTFMMGRYSGELDSSSTEDPQHSVTIPQDYYIGKYEITQQQWLALMSTWPGTAPDGVNGVGNNYPAYFLSWNDAKSFITALNAHIVSTSQGAITFRLPSEAEWEYACRADAATRFYWGDDTSYTQTSSYAWYEGNNSPGGSKPAGTKLANPFGLYDMSGNVWEWCEDDWHSDYTGAPVNGSPWVDAPRATYRSIRGGHWYYSPKYCRSACRRDDTYLFFPYSRNYRIGFRLAAINNCDPDLTPPVITLLGTNPATVECGTTYTDAGATANDVCDGDLTGSIATVNPVTTAVVGSYTVTYNVSDGALNAAVEVTRTVNVVDTTAPTISLSGSNPVDVECGATYTDAGATAADVCGGNLTAAIATVNPVNAAIPGTYTVTYNVSDAASNAAAQVTRTVNVTDTTAPVITLVGDNPVTIECGATYTDAGATASDICGGSLTASIVTTNPVNTAVPGSYTIRYNVSDVAANAATEVTRTVNVVDTTVPIITLVGVNPQIISMGSSYTELGANAADLCDGNLSASIIADASSVNTNAVGTYTVTYNVTDTASNAATQKTRSVNVVDTSQPFVTDVLVQSDLTVQVTFSELMGTGVNVPGNYTISGAGRGTLNAQPDTVTMLSGITYRLSWSCPGIMRSGSDVTITVNAAVQDSATNAMLPGGEFNTHTGGGMAAAPVITLLGDNPVTVECSTTYTDSGATAADSCSTDLTASIVTTNPVDPDVPGVYTVRYNVSDGAANPATEVTRTVNVVDTISPVITRTGTSPVTVECGSVYTDAGATASDTCDGDLTAAITTNNPVNTGAPGSYTVRYTVSDTASNAATEVTRTVNVLDTTAPVISLVGDDPVTVECGTVYTDAGAEASDICGGNLTGSIVTMNPVNPDVPGSYTVTYTVSDSSSNAAAEVTRTVNVTDTDAPVLTLMGDATVEVECGDTYTDGGATAADTCGGDLTASIVTVNPVNAAVPGTYTVTYNVSDAASNAATEVTRTVEVVDTTAPVITLQGESPVTVECGGSYTDAGATAADVCGGDLTASIAAVNSVDTAIPGTYTVTYNVSDAVLNAATEATRTVNVVDAAAPAITLLGDNPITVECGDTYTDEGATAADACDGDLTASVVTVNPVNTATVGSYTITYNVSDSASNAAVEVTRAVSVVDTTVPVITLLGDDPVTVECGTTYTDAGAEASDNCDGDLTGSIVTVNPVDPWTVGVYTVTYNISDAADNAAVEVTRTVNVVDTTAPVITLVGDTPATVECGGNYIDAGATAADVCGGDLTASIVAVNPVNAAVPGTYTVTYNVSDAAANTATEISRIVEVMDMTAPVITLTGDATVELECGETYTDAGATAADVCDGDMTGSIVTVNPVDINTAGQYTVSYNVADAASNAAIEVTRTVTINDTTAPVLNLVGDAAVTVECGSTYTDAGAMADDSCDGNLSASIVVAGDAVDTTTVGLYTITYNVSDSASQAAVEISRAVTVQDTTVPVLTLVGDASVTMECGENYTDPGATALDACDGDLTADITVGGDTVDTGNTGTYTITYNVSDAVSIAAVEITRTVIVEDTTVPVITLLGDALVTVECGSSYTDAGATALDACDGTLDSSVVLSGDAVNTAVPGDYVLRYNVTDSASNVAVELTRTVTVQDTTAPVITLLGDASVTVECGGSYIDAGATATDVCDGDLTTEITTVNTVDESIAGVYTVTYNVSDTAINEAVEVIRQVTVTDTSSPVISTCADDKSVVTDVDGNTLVPDFVDVVATDNCIPAGTGLTVTQFPVAGTQVGIGVHEITITVSDAAGNSNTCTAQLTVTAWPWRFGDTNLDGDITASDVTEIMRLVGGGTPIGPEALVTADIDRDGSITESDMLAVFAFIRSGGIVREVPKNLMAQSGVNEIILLWGPVPHDNVLGYVVARRAEGEVNWTRFPETGDPVYYDKNIASVRYEYQVAVIDVLGNVETFSLPVTVLGNTLTLWAPWAQGLAGEEVIAPIGIGSTRGLNPKNVSITVNYDFDMMEYQGVLTTVLSSPLEYFVEDSTPGRITILATAPEGQLPIGEGRFFDLKMKLKNDVPQGCQNTLISEVVILNSSGSAVATYPIAGTVCAGDVRWGDMNQDGVVSDEDAAAVLDLAVHNETPTAQQLFLGDLNGDRRIDAADAVLILRLAQGLSINPPQEEKNAVDKDFGSRFVSLPSALSVPKGCQFLLPVTIDNASSMAGLDLVVSYTRADLRCDAVCPSAETTGHTFMTDLGTGYVRISLSDAEALPEGETIVAYMIFTVIGDVTLEGVRPAPRVRINYAELKGELGESFRWYGDITRQDAVVTILDAGTCEAVPDCDELTGEGEMETGSLRVYLGPATAVTAGAQWRRVGTSTWLNHEATESGIVSGSYQVEFKPVNCWAEPEPQSVLIETNQLTTITGTYTAVGCEGEGEPVEGEGEITEGEGETIEGELVEGEGETTEGEPVEGESLTPDEIMQMLLDAFETADTNGDGKLSYEEALAIITGLTRDQFNALDTNGDGFLSMEELGCDRRCGCCKCTNNTKIDIKRYIGDWLLVGLSLLVLISLASRHRR